MEDNIFSIILNIIAGIERALWHLSPHMITPFILTIFINTLLKKYFKTDEGKKRLRYYNMVIFFIILVAYITILANFGILKK